MGKQFDFSTNYDDDEDFDDSHYAFSIGYDGNIPTKDMSYRPTFSYKYIDLDKTEYNFHRVEFDVKDRSIYFNKLKKYSQHSLQDLVDSKNPDEHFKINPDWRGREYRILEQALGHELDDATMPILGHFALYTPPNYDPAKKEQCPRIFFLVGAGSVLHLLFYDPFHEIHPMGASTKKALSK